MKHLKKFESKNINKYKNGELLIFLRRGYRQLVSVISFDDTDDDLPYLIKYIDDTDDTILWARESDLEKPTQDELEQYELEQSTNKYNL